MDEVASRRARRRCDACQTILWGRRGHGFPSANGRWIRCGGCKDVPKIVARPPARVDATGH